MLIFLHTFTPHPVLLTVGSISIHWYGLILASGILLGYGLAVRLARERNFDSELITEIYTSLIIWGLLGARLYHVLGDWFYYAQNPAKIIAVWEGGLAIHGAIIAGAATLYYYTKKQRLSFWSLADLFSLPLILGQALGRWGNYFNQELFGRPTSLAWGIPIDLANRPLDYVNSVYFHPTFLYESLWDFLALGALYYLWRKKMTTPNPSLVKEGRLNGLVFWAYLGLYALGRGGVELLRVNPTPIIFGARLPFLVSAVLALASAVFLVRLWRERRG